MKTVIGIKIGQAIPDNAKYIDKNFVEATIINEAHYIFFYEVPIEVPKNTTITFCNNEIVSNQLDLFKELEHNTHNAFDKLYHNG